MILTVISGNNHEYIAFEPPINLAKLLRESGEPFSSAWSEHNMFCGGNAICLKCKLQVTGNVSEPSESEKSLLNQSEIYRNIRYACMTTLLGNVEVVLNENIEESKSTMNIQINGYTPEFYLKPWGSKLGMAIDVGTTTVVAYLYNLQTGKRLAMVSAINPQKSLGADVVSRIGNSMAGNKDSLAKMIKNCIETLSQKLCHMAESFDGIDSVVITGNTAMMYFLTSSDVNTIAFSPFLQNRFFGEFIKAEDLNLNIFAKAKECLVYLTRSISAYVGGDITTAILSSEIYKADKPCLLIDIGTNGEIVLHSGGKLYACSAAAGPAFEGGDIEMGMNAENGAISYVFLSNGIISFEVIGGFSPKGICGSGIIDLVAVMLRAGIIDYTGLIKTSGHNFTNFVEGEEGQAVFTIPGSNVFITQKDIRNIQMAKAAICAAISSLLKFARVDESLITSLKIAGGFGMYIDLSSAMQIGLFSKKLAEKAVCIGNAAASGSALILLNNDLRILSENIAKTTETVDLMKNDYFTEEYIKQMFFD